MDQKIPSTELQMKKQGTEFNTNSVSPRKEDSWGPKIDQFQSEETVTAEERQQNIIFYLSERSISFQIADTVRRAISCVCPKTRHHHHHLHLFRPFNLRILPVECLLSLDRVCVM